MAGSLIQRHNGGKGGQQGEKLHFPAGSQLFDPSQPSRRLYRVRSGLVQLSSAGKVIVDHLTAGYFFGEKFLLPSPWAGQAAKSLSPTTVTAFGKSELLDRVQQNRRFALQLLRNLATRLDRYEQTICELMTEPAERRLALLLLRSMPARPSSGWARLPFSPTNPELARMIGTTRWQVSHFLSHFHRLGWLRRQKGRLWLDREGLNEFLQLSRAA